MVAENVARHSGVIVSSVSAQPFVTISAIFWANREYSRGVPELIASSPKLTGCWEMKYSRRESDKHLTCLPTSISTCGVRRSLISALAGWGEAARGSNVLCSTWLRLVSTDWLHSRMCCQFKKSWAGMSHLCSESPL